MNIEVYNLEIEESSMRNPQASWNFVAKIGEKYYQGSGMDDGYEPGYNHVRKDLVQADSLELFGSYEAEEFSWGWELLNSQF